MPIRCPSCHAPLAPNDAVCFACGARAPSLSELPEAVTMALPPGGVSRELLRAQPHGTQAVDGIELPPAAGFERDVSASPGGVNGPGPDALADAANRGIGIAPGAIFADRFRIIEPLGSGGMGAVFRARDTRLEQDVALKVLRGELAANPEAMELLAREVRAARQIAHPCVCRVFDLGRVESPAGVHHYISMELVDGETLERLLRRIGRLPEAKSLQIARELCGGLAAIHDRGVLHRDLKPSNVMVDGRGHSRITDFGLAVDDRARAGARRPAGTPGYVAPEVLDGRNPSTASDIYALGLVLYELFTGVPAYPPGSVSGMLTAQGRDDPPRPALIDPSIRPEIERVILACIERRPERRPASALMVAAMLPGGDPLKAALAAGLTPSPDTVAAAGRRGVLPIAHACAVMAVLAVAIAIVTWLGSRTSIMSVVPDLKSPSVMIDRARDVLARVGAGDRSGGSVGFFDFDDGLMERLNAPDPPQIGRGELVGFIYRQGSIDFTTRDARGVVAFDDPPGDTPGVSTVRLDHAGRLRELRVQIPQATSEPIPDGGPATNATDPIEALFNAAGLRMADARPATPRGRPPMYVDARLAWTLDDAEGTGREFRVEAATLEGKPVWFLVEDPARGAWAPGLLFRMPDRINAGDVIAIVLQFGAILAGLGLGVVNIRRRRSDLRGAVKFGVLLGAVSLVGGLMSVQAPPRDGLMLTVLFCVALGLFNTGVGFLLYAALEPYARRMWPETLISWARLVQGRWSDPLVGRDMMLGVTAGLVCAALFCLAVFVPYWLGHAPLPPADTDDFVLWSWSGVRALIASNLQGIQAAVVVTSAAVIALILLKFVLRRRDLAAAALALLQASTWGLAGGIHGVGWVFIVLMGVVMIGTLTHVGLLATAVAIFSGYGVMTSPLTTDMGTWYAPWMMTPIAISVLLAVVGAAVAVRGGRSE